MGYSKKATQKAGGRVFKSLRPYGPPFSTGQAVPAAVAGTNRAIRLVLKLFFLAVRYEM